MSLARVMYILGVVLIVYAFISGAYFTYKMTGDGSSFDSGYTFKLGMFLVGVLLVYLGRKSSKSS